MAQKFLIVAVRDRAANVFGRPAFTTTRGVAIRSFAEEINRPDQNNQFAKTPEDFDLYELGTWNDETGEFESKRPEQIAVGKDLVR